MDLKISVLKHAATLAQLSLLGQFPNSVELDILVQIIAQQYDLNPGYLRKLRSDSVKNVKQTSGRVSLANAVRESDEAEWQG